MHNEDGTYREDEAKSRVTMRATYTLVHPFELVLYVGI